MKRVLTSFQNGVRANQKFSSESSKMILTLYISKTWILKTRLYLKKKKAGSPIMNWVDIWKKKLTHALVSSGHIETALEKRKD